MMMASSNLGGDQTVLAKPNVKLADGNAAALVSPHTICATNHNNTLRHKNAIQNLPGTPMLLKILRMHPLFPQLKRRLKQKLPHWRPS